MDLAALRIVAYYRSPEGADDLRRLDEADPPQAEERRRAIARQLNENLAALGATQSEADQAAQARFIKGDPRAAAFLALYAQSISARWSEAS